MAQNKITGYQKLKKENQELRRKLTVLALSPASIDAISIKKEIEIGSDIENAVYAGNPGSQQFEGLIKSIAQ